MILLKYMVRVVRERLAVKWQYILASTVCVAISLLAYQQTFGALTPIGWGDVGGVRLDVRVQPDATGGLWHIPGCVPQRIDVEGSSRFETEACVVETTDIALASYPDLDMPNNLVNYALKVGGDSRFHAVLNGTYPSSLVLLKDGRLMGNRWHSSELFIATTSALRPYFEQVSEHDVMKTYSLYIPQDLTITNGLGNSIEPKRIDISDNNLYAAVESRSRSHVLVDIATRRATYVGINKEYNNDETVVQAVSSDGKYLAVVNTLYRMGELYIIDESCGRTAPYPSPPTCDSIDFSDHLQANSTLAGTIPYELSFSSDSSKLVMKSYIEGTAGIVEATITPDTSTLQVKYLALGDSYSSGEGDIADWPTNYYISGTEADGSCHLSSRSYPFLLRDKWGISSLAMKSVACSGALVLPDFFGEGRYDGQGDQPALAKDERLRRYDQALQDFTPGIARQIDFIERYKPAKVTFTGGGNDVGFAGILSYCATSALISGASCTYVSSSQLRADLNGQIDSQYVHNKQFIEKIKEVSPATEIYMIGYPQFVSLGRLWCSDNSPMLNRQERIMIRESVTRLNNILKKVARDTGVYYVDIEDSLAGGQICDGSSYITGPLGVAFTKFKFETDGNMYHPNHRGHAKMADAIHQKIANGMDYHILDIPLEANGRRVVRMAVLPDYVGIGSTHTITMDASMFGPNGEVYIEMFSQHAHLGTATIDADGMLRTTVTVPKSVGAGTHLLTISGVDPDGETVSVQQFVTVVSNTPSDADADGIPDDEDPCFALFEWYENGVDMCATNKQQSRPVIDRLIMPGRDELTDTTTTGKVVFERSSSAAVVMSDEVDDITSDDYAPKRTNINKTDTHNNLNSWWVLGGVGIIMTGVTLYYAKRKNQQAK